MKTRFSEILLRAADATEGNAPPSPQLANPPVDAPTCFDVINGRGQGIQRHPGNVKYRKLVSVSKDLYGKCPGANKGKISKGIVASIRNLGGRFLELDEQSGTYVDIGDKKAYEKTSQALRDGRSKTRQKLLKKNAANSFDASHAKSNQAGFLAPERGSGYSVQVLESLLSLGQDLPAQASTAHQRARNSPFDRSAPQTALGSGGAVAVEKTPVGRYVDPSPSHDFGNLRAAALVEDEARRMTQISYYQLMLSMLCRADAEENVRSRLLPKPSPTNGTARSIPGIAYQSPASGSFGVNTECEL